MNKASFTVIVCTKDRPDQLRRCLSSLTRLDHPDFELLIVDNTPGAPATAAIADEFEARLLIEPLQGLTRARNAGATAARGDLIAFIDDDATADPGLLMHHAAALGDPAIGATTGRVLPLDATQPSAILYTDFGSEPFRVDSGVDDWFERSSFGGVGLGGNMVFRRSLFANGLRFHQGLGLGAPIQGADEHYAFFTLLRDGHAITYVPDAVVRHEGPATVADFELRSRQQLEAFAAYLAMLVLDEPGFRRQALRYALTRARAEEPDWRPGFERLGSSRQRYAAAASGAFSYLRHRRTVKRGRPPRGASSEGFAAP